MYDLIVLGALGLFAVELRFSVYVMVLPVCGVLWLFRVWKEKGRDKKNLLIPVIAAGCWESMAWEFLLAMEIKAGQATGFIMITGP